MPPQLRPPRRMDPTSKEGQEKAKSYREMTPDWIEKIIDFAIGSPEDPNTMLGSFTPASVGTMPMVSAYAKFFGPEGAKAARMKATDSVIAAIKEAGEMIGAPPEQIEKAVAFVNKNPRVMAHQALSVKEAVPGNPKAVASHRASGHGLGEITLTPSSKDSFVEDIIHEGMHGAQNIGHKDQFGTLYREANDFLGGGDTGYFPNPYERAARNAVDTRVPMQGGNLRLTAASRNRAGINRTPPLLDMLKEIGVVDPNIPNTDFIGTIKRFMGGG